jgi:hypothetical protein
MKIYTSILALVAVALLTFAGELKPISYADNLLDAVSKPTDQQDVFIKGEAQKLAKSQVPTREDALKLALGVFGSKPGLDALETWRVTGLYRIGRDAGKFTKAGDLVWEIRITRMGNNPGVSGVIWVSTTTKSVKILFPFDA